MVDPIPMEQEGNLLYTMHYITNWTKAQLQWTKYIALPLGDSRTNWDEGLMCILIYTLHSVPTEQLYHIEKVPYRNGTMSRWYYIKIKPYGKGIIYKFDKIHRTGWSST